MKKILDNLLCWCNNPDDNCIEQGKNLANHPWTIGNVCLMPDTHAGMGMPIGGVWALDYAICPTACGVDIGCGMFACKTSLTKINQTNLKKVMSKIRKRVPVGMGMYNPEPQHNMIFDLPEWNYANVCLSQKKSAAYQLGTLGSGNHFIEIQKGSDGHIWFMIHSGSRNLGKKICEYYNAIAKELANRWKYQNLIEQDLCVLPQGEKAFSDYLTEMNLCLKFAKANRELIANRIKDSFTEVFPDIKFEAQDDIHHNYTALENHYGKNVWVHRKGATLARENIVGIIPGSQGTASYIVKGKGNEASMCSCSHGAGRKLSRSAARQNLNLEEEIQKLNDKGIIHAIRSVNDLDEAASAYKDIDVVMSEQQDLVEIMIKLEPLAVIKG